MYRTTTTEAAEGIEDGSLDWVFIDADHSFRGVSEDIANWLPKIRKGGMVIGHDIDREGVRLAVEQHFGVEWETKDKAWNNCWWARV